MSARPRLALVVAALVFSRAALAAADEPDPGEKRQEAAGHFEKGNGLLHDEAWSAALAEFLQSRRLYPTWSATSNAAVCLKQLHRFDEALELFEVLLREFSETLPEKVKAAAQSEVVTLRGLVGTIDVTVERAPPGATVVVDGQDRGEYPLLTPVRVSAGSHVVRVYKEGFEPVEERIDVAGAQVAPFVARLRALVKQGRLPVVEQDHQALSVFVDGSPVGKTPWEGALPPGNHTVFLVGDGDLGSQPVSVPVRLDETTPLTLTAEPLSASLRIVPTPMSANLAIDAVTVGRGAWQGRLRVGPHTVEIAADGFLTESRKVTLTAGNNESVLVTLQRDTSSPFWQTPTRKPRFVVELSGGVVLLPSFGGDVAGGCIQGCSGGPGVGGYALARFGYELGGGFGFGLAGGYLEASQSSRDREATATPIGLEPDKTTMTDTLLLRGGLVGAWLSFRIPTQLPIHFRLNVGAELGSIEDSRTGTLSARNLDLVPFGPIVQRHASRAVFFAPEVRVGLVSFRRLELSLGLQTLLLIHPSPPSWETKDLFGAGSDGNARFPPEQLIAPVVFLLAPGLSGRYDL